MHARRGDFRCCVPRCRTPRHGEEGRRCSDRGKPAAVRAELVMRRLRQGAIRGGPPVARLGPETTEGLTALLSYSFSHFFSFCAKQTKKIRVSPL